MITRKYFYSYKYYQKNEKNAVLNQYKKTVFKILKSNKLNIGLSEKCVNVKKNVFLQHYLLFKRIIYTQRQK